MSTTRLPVPGNDDGTWGNILNAFLEVAHATDGSLLRDADITTALTLANSSVQTTGSQTIAGVKTFTSSPIVPTPASSTAAANKAYVDANTSILPGTGQNPLTGMWHVDGYGAVGNGTTADSTAFQNAINAAATAGGGTVYCSAKTYLISGVYLATNVTLAGAGKGATVLLQDPAGTGGQWVIRVANGSTTAASFVTVRDLTVDGNKTTLGDGQTSKWYGYYLGTGTAGLVTDCTVDRVELRHCIGYALDVVNAKRVTVTDCESHDNGFTTGVGTYNNGSGFEVLADDITLIGCRAWNNANKGFMSGEGGVTHYRTKFVACTAEANSFEGFYFHDGLSDSAIQGGASRDNGASGIALASSTTHCSITNVAITGNAGNGIRLDNASYNTVMGCVLDGNTPGSPGNPELYFVTASSHNTVVGLVINATRATNAIQEVSGCDYQTLRANTVQAGATVLTGAHTTTSDASSVTISTATPQPDGVPTAGSTGLPSDGGHVHLKQVAWAPSDSALIVASDDPARIASSVTVNGGVLFLTRLPILQTVTIANVLINVNTSGSGLTASQNFVGVYSQSGALIGSSADQTAAFGSSGSKTIAVTAQSAGSLTVTGGASVFVWAAILANGTTTPLMGRVGTNNSMANLGFSAANYRFASIGTGQTTLPLNFTPASLASVSAIWAAIS